MRTMLGLFMFTTQYLMIKGVKRRRSVLCSTAVRVSKSNEILKAPANMQAPRSSPPQSHFMTLRRQREIMLCFIPSRWFDFRFNAAKTNVISLNYSVRLRAYKGKLIILSGFLFWFPLRYYIV